MGLPIRGFSSDVRVAIRNHRRMPVSSLVTALSLGLGIGSVALALALVQQFVFPPPVGYSAPERLATLYTSRADGDSYGLSSYADFLDLRNDLDTLDDLAAVAVRFFGLEDTREDEERLRKTVPLFVEEVSGNFFRVTGISPSLGRGIDQSDVSVEAPWAAGQPIVVLGHDVWKNRFAADPGILGQTVRLDGDPFTVVGVAPDGIIGRRAPLEVDAWIPVGLDARSRPGRYRERDQRSFLLLGRLRPQSSLDQLQAQAAVIAGRLASEHTSWRVDDRQRALTAVSERASRVNPRARGLLLAIGLFFVGAASLVLLLACSNAASLFLSRASARTREISIRRSLGSTRGHLVRLWLVDGLLPGLAAGAVGLVALWTCRRALAAFSLPLNIPVDLDLDIRPTVFLLVFVLSVGASVLFALAPSLVGLRANLSSTLRSGAMSAPRRRFMGGSARNLPVLVQCAAAVVLLVGASLFVRSATSSTIDLGLDPEGIAIASAKLVREGDSGVHGSSRDHEHDESRRSDSQAQHYQTVLDLLLRLEALPNVERAVAARRAELTLLGVDSRVEIVGLFAGQGLSEENPIVYRNAVTPGYFETLSVPLIAGRDIASVDRPGSPRVAVVNETLAHRFWPDTDAVGRRLTLREPSTSVGADSTERTVEVIGVARDGKYLDFDDAPTPYLWLALAQDLPDEVALLARGAPEATSLVSAMQSVLDESALRVGQVPPSLLEEQISIQFLHLRLASRILAWTGVFGLLLAALGIYGVVALAAQQRRRELAVRMAIGARRDQLVHTVLGSSSKLVGAGLLVGLAVAVPLATLMRGVLLVSPIDPVSLIASAGLLLMVGVMASFGPTRQALRRDPLAALKED